VKLGVRFATDAGIVTRTFTVPADLTAGRTTSSH
jgi:hypothetical protein